MKNKIFVLIFALIIVLYVPPVYAATCPLGTDVTKDLAEILHIMQVIGPLLVVVLTVYETVQAITKKEIQGETKKIFIRLIKRFVYCLLLFFVPAIVETGAKIAGIDVSSCDLNNPTSNNYNVITTARKTLSTTIDPNFYNSSYSYSGDISEIFAAAKKADQLTYSNGYHYGDAQSWDGTNMNGVRSSGSGTCPAYHGTTGLTVSCDRGVALALYYAGLIKDDPYKYNLETLNSFLANNGWKKITNFSDIKAGDIVFYDRDHNGSLEATDHVFLVGEEVNKRYDWGSCDRIHHNGQYSSGMPFTENIDSGQFGWAYRKV